jgi:pimeloyl-ACP methyl ester carboxylesterase
VETSPERRAHVGGLVARAKRRRAHWPSREAARRWLAERELFADFDPRALDLYVLDALGERPDGSAWLKAPGEVEAAIFSGGAELDVFDLAAGIGVPTLFLWAARGSFSRAVYERLAASMAAARVESVDAGHLVPMERPDLVVDAIRRFTAAAPSRLSSDPCPTRA